VCQGILDDTLLNLTNSSYPQQPAAIRVLYALGVGWWVSLVWTLVAWIDSLSIERRPTAVERFMRLPRLANLRMYSLPSRSRE
jgi:hypothetical protein